MSGPQFSRATCEKRYGCSAIRVETTRVIRKRVLKIFSLKLFLGLLLILGFSGSVVAQEITGQGRRLIKLLDGMNVEQLWLPYQKVYWRTGRPRGEPVNDGKPHTHCSAFVAAAAEKLGVYILHPPEHSTIRLANAQADWLSRKGENYGWRAVRTPEEAQQLANSGVLVVAVYKERLPRRSGHIAIVRPKVKTLKLIREEGPQITQAGLENYASTSLKQGFKHHKGAWKKREVRFYSHAVNWEACRADIRRTAFFFSSISRA